MEVMACPGGCLNGGGQPRQPAAALSASVAAGVVADAGSANHTDSLGGVEDAGAANTATGAHKRRAVASEAAGSTGTTAVRQVSTGGTRSVALRLEELEAVYRHADVALLRPGDSPDAMRLYREWLGGGPGSGAARDVLRTQYHKREKSVGVAIADW